MEKQAQMAQETTLQQDMMITYTVAECGEFHSMGAYHDNIPTNRLNLTFWNTPMRYDEKIV